MELEQEDSVGDLVNVSSVRTHKSFGVFHFQCRLCIVVYVCHHTGSYLSMGQSYKCGHSVVNNPNHDYAGWLADYYGHDGWPKVQVHEL